MVIETREALPNERDGGDEDQSALVTEVHGRLLREMDLSAVEKLAADRARGAVERGARELLAQIRPGLLGEDREDVISRVVDEAIGYGPIEPLLRDPSISEIMVNDIDDVYFERDGVIYLAACRFQSSAHIMRIVERMIAPIGRRVDESSPYVDARLPDGSRVNVIIPPLSPRSPALTIRKFRPDRYRLGDLVTIGSFTKEVADFLRACVEQRLNIVISGGTGTGKTTLLNAVSEFIPERERIVTIEDPIEMRLQQRHVVPLETRPANIEGANEVSQRDLVRNALRMRPDRIIIGEVRGGEAFDMLQAMNTGHEGSLTTVHANSPRDALSRIENMVLMTGLDLPVRSIREQMASALDLVVQIVRHADGKRRIANISEITGVESGVITMQDLYVFEQTGVTRDGAIEGSLQPSGITPTFSERFRQAGVVLQNSFIERRWN